MFLVLRSVSWYDWGTLADGQTQVRILNWADVRDDPRLADPQRIDEVRVRIEGAPGEIALGALARGPDGAPELEIGLAGAWTSSDLGLVALALLVFAPVPLLQSIRFTWMVRAQDIELSYWEGIKLSYAGNFLNFVALGSTGGDLFKAYYVSTHTDRKAEAVTTVFLDRAVGLGSLVLVGTIALCARVEDPRVREWWPVLGLLSAGLVVSGVALLSRRVRRALRVERILGRLPFSAQLLRIDAAGHRLRYHKAVLLSALGLTVALQALALTAFTLAAIGLGMRSGWALYPGYFVYLTLALLVAAVPISYQGVGTMDGVLQLLFRGTYGTYSQILLLGFAMRILQLGWALPGFLVPLTGAHRPSAEKLAQLHPAAAGVVSAESTPQGDPG